MLLRWSEAIIRGRYAFVLEEGHFSVAGLLVWLTLDLGTIWAFENFIHEAVLKFPPYGEAFRFFYAFVIFEVVVFVLHKAVIQVKKVLELIAVEIFHQ
jgi:hypothetical protein